MEFRASKLSVCIVKNASDADARNTKPALAEPLWGRFGLLGELLGRSGGTPKAAGGSLEALWGASRGPGTDPWNSRGLGRPNVALVMQIMHQTQMPGTQSRHYRRLPEAVAGADFWAS